MNPSKALEIAQKIAADRCTVALHEGATPRDRAIRISGCYPEQAHPVGMEIERALPGGSFQTDSQWSAVWFDPSEESARD